MNLILRELEIGDEAEARAAHLEFPDWDFLLALGRQADIAQVPWSKHVEDCRNMRLGIDLPKGRVPATFLIAEVAGELIGRASIRHELNTFLFNYGGHIGYGVRPQFRRRGYATEILRQSLEDIRALGVDDVLLTCFDENVGIVGKCRGRKIARALDCVGKILASEKGHHQLPTHGSAGDQSGR